MSWSQAGLWVLDVAAIAVADARWLRVAQREHYEPGRIGAFQRLWVGSSALNALLAAVAIVAVVLGVAPGWALATALGLLLLAVSPWGLKPWPTSGKLALTPRFRRLLGLTTVLDALLLLAARSPHVGAFVALFAALVADIATYALAPVERALSKRFVVEAQQKLAKVRPRIVAITGSYGKTSTKLYVRQLLSGSTAVVASPASFNNLMGLSRTVNDNLPAGTEVFVAEMGTYGRGEIRKLCEIFPPDVAAIVTIGEAHLERMKDRATIVAAKSEITEKAGTVVLNVDVPELAALADQLDGDRTVVRVSTTPGSGADVVVIGSVSTWHVVVKGTEITEIALPDTGHPINLAVAVGISLGLGLDEATIARALTHLPAPPHRAEVTRTDTGVTVIDDTYNSNPDGARRALEAAAALKQDGGRIWTITPGMVELGSEQDERNRALGALATAAPEMTLVVTGQTNRRALVAGAIGPGKLLTMPTRQAAARTVMAEAAAGDVVLYENDLPDHYP